MTVTDAGTAHASDTGTGAPAGSDPAEVAVVPGRTGPVVKILGIRHHGPGSARAVRAALDRLQPDAVVIEGPADADPVTALAADPGLEPPVALLAYATDAPGEAAFWPFAVFSPEWQALRWAHEHGVPVRFCDLPSTISLGQRHPRDTDAQAPGQGPAADAENVDDDELGEAAAREVRLDPIATLAHAAGYDDPERWWDDVVESRLDAPAPFEVITEAMAALREAAPSIPGAAQLVEDQREAHMRQTLRDTLKKGAGRVAVVCGAWHAPALSGKLPPAAGDARLLRGLPKRKTTVTWVPWTHSRLSYASGYGAGITSPGWYHHLFTAADEPITRWLTKVACVLRAEDLPVSSAHVIEAVRLADTLAVLRSRPLAGLAEVTEATRSVMVEGNEAVLALVTDRLVVGEAMGAVPDSAPTVPLNADLRATAKRLRLKQDPAAKALDLDLRNTNDLARSQLLHRLTLLGIDWGRPATAQVRSTGTFRESWQLAWAPELAVDIVEAAVWGTTVTSAAAARATSNAATATLPALTALVERCLLADLPDALDAAVSALDARAALDLDVAHLMSALPAMVRAARYSDVRGTSSSALEDVAATLLVRICAALPATVTGLDDDGARVLHAALDTVHEAVQLWERPDPTDQWLSTLGRLVDRADVNGLLTGRMARILRDTGRFDTDGAALRLARALSRGPDPAGKAAWVEGFLGGGGLLLVHDAALLDLLDGWLCSLPEQDFTDVLPLLRRTFGAFTVPERRSLGDAVAHRSTTATTASSDIVINTEAALPALHTAALLLGAPA